MARIVLLISVLSILALAHANPAPAAATASGGTVVIYECDGTCKEDIVDGKTSQSGGHYVTLTGASASSYIDHMFPSDMFPSDMFPSVPSTTFQAAAVTSSPATAATTTNKPNSAAGRTSSNELMGYVAAAAGAAGLVFAAIP